MFINELSEPQLLVIYPGRFQPFHKGHHAVYDWLAGKFGRNNVYIATSNKVEGDRSPFSFSEKSYFMQLTGVPADRIVQATSPYNIQNVLAGGNIYVADPANTVVIFAVSEKDMAEDPRFKSWHKKDGSPAYFQPLKSLDQTENMDQHGYILTVPTFDFTVLGQPMRSGTELRNMYSNADEQQRKAIIADLFGRYTHEAEQIMNSKIGQVVKENTDRSKVDPKLPSLLNKAFIAHPLANSDEEALALYLDDKHKKDVDHVEDEEHYLEKEVRQLQKEFAALRQDLQALTLRPVSEARIHNPKKIDVYFKPHRGSEGARVVAKNIPARALDILIRGMCKKFGVSENDFVWRPVDEPHGTKISEAGGVGVVKDGNDPRYVMATAGAQNDVNSSTMGKEMAAFYPTKAPKSQQRQVSRDIAKGTKK